MPIGASDRRVKIPIEWQTGIYLILVQNSIDFANIIFRFFINVTYTIVFIYIDTNKLVVKRKTNCFLLKRNKNEIKRTYINDNNVDKCQQMHKEENGRKTNNNYKNTF